MNTVKGLLKSGLAVAGLIVGLGVSHVYADNAEPIALNPDGTARGAQAESMDGIASAAFPKFYLSAPGTGNVAGNGYADEDIMLYNSGPGTWSKAFDGTNNGLPEAADIDALAILNNSGYLSYLMSFESPTAVPGRGTVDDSDVVRFDTWNSAWSVYLDGSTVGLSTDGEDIDALSFSPGGFLVVSTLGGYNVPNMEGGNLTGNDKDLILFVNNPAGTWTRWLRGATIGMASSNDIKGVSFVRYDEAVIKDGRYIIGQTGWTLPNGVAIGASDVSEQLWFQNGSTEYYKRLDASDLGFPKIDAIEVLK